MNSAAEELPLPDVAPVPDDAQDEMRLLKAGIAQIPREWFRPDDWRVFRQGAGDVLVLATGAAVCLLFPTLWVRIPVWILMAGRMHGLGVLMHDLVHLPSMKKPSAKKVLFDFVVCYPILMNMDYYGLAHLIHHQESNVRGRDPYFVPLHEQHPAAYGIYVAVGSFLLFAVLALRLVLWPLTLVSTSFKRLHIKAFSQLGASPDLENPERQELGRAIWAWAAGPLLFWTALCAAFTLTGTWPLFMAAYGMPMLLSTVLGQVRLACDHIYTEALGSSLVEQVAGATNTEAPWWQQIVMGAHGTSYHALHHLVPTLPNYRLHDAHEIMKTCGSKVYERTVYPGYGAVLMQLLRAQLAWSRNKAAR